MKRLLLILPALLLVSPVLRADGVDKRIFNQAPQPEQEITEPAPWKEGETPLPPYPQDSRMLPLSVDTANQNFSFLIDPKSISVGSDQVVRYAIAVESRSGARNLFYEGMRCDTREYKLYATGGGDGRWHPLSAPRWRPISGDGAIHYRSDLYRFYLCVRGRPMGDVAAIIDNIKYPRNIDRDTLY